MNKIWPSAKFACTNEGCLNSPKLWHRALKACYFLQQLIWQWVCCFIQLLIWHWALNTRCFPQKLISLQNCLNHPQSALVGTALARRQKQFTWNHKQSWMPWPYWPLAWQLCFQGGCSEEKFSMLNAEFNKFKMRTAFIFRYII